MSAYHIMFNMQRLPLHAYFGLSASTECCALTITPVHLIIWVSQSQFPVHNTPGLKSWACTADPVAAASRLVASHPDVGLGISVVFDVGLIIEGFQQLEFVQTLTIAANQRLSHISGSFR